MMPIPVPVPDESRKDFMARCVSDEKMKQEFPNDTQRIAVCAVQWRDKDKAKSNEK